MTCLLRNWLFLGSLLVSAMLTVPTYAQCVNSHRSPGDIVGYDSIKLVPQNLPSSLQQKLADGMAQWNNSNCNKSGNDFPRFTLGTPEGTYRTIQVQYHDGIGPNSSACGGFSGNTINLYKVAYSGGQLVPCTDPTSFPDTFAHELGHALGLDHINDNNCSSYIMSSRQVSPSGAYTDRQVQPAECQTVSDTNETPSEQEDPCSETSTSNLDFNLATSPLIIPCDDGGGAGGDSGPGGAGEESGGSNSGTPIILNLDARGFRLTSLEDGVRFDLNGDGWPERVSWTEAGSGDAWLALDRDGSGFIEKGSELFGNYTAQPSSETPHGYRALAVFDEPAQGGNADGVISAEDSIYGHLRLWTDSNHDGRSQQSELQSLVGAGVEWIGLWTVESGRKDQYGNEFRYMSLIGLGHQRARSADVFLLTAP